MKFTVLVENMYLYGDDDYILESWLNESSNDSDTRTMLQKFKDWVKSMTMKLANIIRTSFKKFVSVMKEAWRRCVLLAKRLTGQISKAEYERVKEAVKKHGKLIRDGLTMGHKILNKHADKLKSGEVSSMREAFDKGFKEANDEVAKAFKNAGYPEAFDGDQPPTESSSNSKLSSSFIDAVKSGNTRRVRIMMKDSMLVDPTFAEFKEMDKLASGMSGLYDDKHDGRELNYDKSTWDDSYMNDMMVQIVGNFSKERVDHLKKIVSHLRG